MADILTPAAWTPAPAEWRYPALYCVQACCVANWRDLPTDAEIDTSNRRAARIPQERRR